MSDVGPDDEQPLDKSGDRRRGWGIFDRWGRQIMVASVLVIIASVGVGAWVLSANKSEGREVYVEAADSVGVDPFTTDGIMLVAQPSTGSSTPKSPGLFGGSGDNGVCAPEKLVAFLRSHPDKASAWVAALNADPTLRWSGGDQLEVSDIAAYVAELTPSILKADTRVTNHGFKNGEATPRQSLLRKGTAVLVDRTGAPRVRCYCGNPLHPQGGGGGTGTSVETTPTPETTPSETSAPTPSPTPEVTVSPTSFNDGGTDGDGPEPLNCAPVPPVPSGATDITTAPVDIQGDGTPDLVRVYQDGGVWHVRVEVGGVAMDDDALTGPGPMMAVIGGATVNNDSVEEVWVKVGSGSATDIVGLLVWLECDLQRVELNNVPAEFPVGITATAADGLACFGFDTGIEVFTTTSTDGVTYTGTSTIYTIDLSSSPPSLVLGATANQSENTSGGPSFDRLHSFQCDNLNTIP